MRQRYETLKQVGRVGYAKTFITALNRISAYGGDNIQFAEINFKYLTAFENQMLTDGLKPNAIAVYMRTIRTVINQAINEEVIGQELYPFNKYKIKTQRTAKRALSHGDR